ncbi:hypothetical protein ACFVYT_20890 [Streptomyces sp. NPDC058290]|uniref:hypothetical protein n=1 Tax=Streptomyces sp. NPDC058290 TaxID=3346426 RepID=UPI0036E69410
MRAAPTRRASGPALPKAFNAYARQEHLLPGADDGLTRDAVGRGLTAVVSVKLDDPCFEGATRTRLDSTPTGTYVQEVVHEHPARHPPRSPRVRCVCRRGCGPPRSAGTMRCAR